MVEIVVVVAILAIVATIVVINVSEVRGSAEGTVASVSLSAFRDAICGTSAGTAYLNDMKCIPGFTAANLRVHDLLSPSSYPAYSTFDPVAQRGWRGPYLQNFSPVANTNAARSGMFPLAGDRRTVSDSTFLQRNFHYDSLHSYYGATGDVAAADAWGNPVVLQVPPASAFISTATDAKRFSFARIVSAGPDGILQCPRDRLAGRLADGTCTARVDDLVLFLNRPDVYEPETP